MWRVLGRIAGKKVFSRLENALRRFALPERAQSPPQSTRALWAFFAVQQERCQRASRTGENHEPYQRHQEGENHDEGKAIRRVKEIENLLHPRI